MTDGRRPRVRAPELRGRRWLGTGGAGLSMADLGGRFTILDFWTSGCINCVHVLDELRPLEEKYADELVVISVHSPKFTHEADSASVLSAVARLGITHPVLDDAEMTTWDAYVARAWPTLVLIDPEGYVVAHYAGEGHVHAIDAMIADLLPVYEARGTLRRGRSPYLAPRPVPGDLHFPSTVIKLPSDTLLVADAGSGSLVEIAADVGAVLAAGSGSLIRRYHGFREPNGLLLLPDDVRDTLPYDVVVADTLAHQIVGLSLDDGSTRVLAGDGRPWRQGDGTESLSSPWDVAWWRDRVWIAMAGIHQLWTYDPRTGAVEVAAGTTHEGLGDALLADAWFAQPSRLAPDGDVLWIADPEGSALRQIIERPDGWWVETRVGRGLFEFGFVDGPAERALMQHPLGLAVLPDGSIAIADTYNGAVRRFDPMRRVLSTIATDLVEPSGLVLLDDETLVVVESAAHRLTPIALTASAPATGLSHHTSRPTTEIRAGEVELEVAFTLPPGQHLDDRNGPAIRLFVTSTPQALLREGEGHGASLVRRLVVDPAVGDGVLHVAAMAASCDDDGIGAACHIHQQDWGVPVRVTADGVTRIELPLGETS